MMGFLRTVHAWAGAVLCLFVAVIGITGSLLVFEDDYLRLAIPETRAAVELSPTALGRAAEAVERQFTEGQPRSLILARPGRGIHHLYLNDGRQAYISQDGRVLDIWSGGDRPEALMFELHHDLMLGEFGHITAGVCGIALVLFSITGLILWWPVRRSFSWRVWPRNFGRGAIVAAHRNLGVITALPIILISLTGAGIIFHDETKAALLALFSDEVTRPTVVSEEVLAGDMDWAAAVAAARTQFPEATPRILSWPRAADGPASMRLQQPSEWHPNGRTTVSFNPADASIVSHYDAAAADLGSRIDYLIYPVHAAFVWGRVYDVVSFVSGLSIGVLGLLGAWSFLRWKVRTRRGRRPAPAAAPAAGE